eukprot:TRINITY_DN14217_c0_g1_i1.p2 TRINITY_DN14217_c0_g1~~TRINITY_DN14217_c0_g1_i1.p2  ORF type:complete len:100 (-),score=28.88 TRINITY_DN14217_c0_g1_i1:100-399(-)
MCIRDRYMGADQSDNMLITMNKTSQSMIMTDPQMPQVIRTTHKDVIDAIMTFSGLFIESQMTGCADTFCDRGKFVAYEGEMDGNKSCLLYTSPSPRDQA